MLTDMQDSVDELHDKTEAIDLVSLPAMARFNATRTPSLSPSKAHAWQNLATGHASPQQEQIKGVRNNITTTASATT
jgi:hypothetical protein